MASALTLHPCMNFFRSKAPIFSQPDTGQPFDRALARSSIDPGDWHMQHVGDLLNRKKLPLSFPCGHVPSFLRCGGLQRNFFRTSGKRLLPA